LRTIAFLEKNHIVFNLVDLSSRSIETRLQQRLRIRERHSAIGQRQARAPQSRVLDLGRPGETVEDLEVGLGLCLTRWCLKLLDSSSIFDEVRPVALEVLRLLDQMGLKHPILREKLLLVPQEGVYSFNRWCNCGDVVDELHFRNTKWRRRRTARGQARKHNTT
jgi:hypothetical protein